MSEFLEPSWTNADDFLVKHRDSFNDLKDFYNSLETFTDTLKSQLTSIINDDYTDFVSISKQLLQLGENMNILLKILKVSDSMINQTINNLSVSILPYRAQYDKLLAVKHESLTCLIGMECIESLQWIEKMINNSQDVFFLYDIAIVFSMILAKMKRIDQPALVKPIQNEYNKLMGLFAISLSSSFINSIKNRLKENLFIILNSAIIVGLEDQLYSTLSDDQVKPFLKSLEVFKKYDRIITSILEFVSNPNGIIRFLVEVSPNGFDFIQFSLWPCVSYWLEAKIIFPISNANEIHCSYSLFFNFISNIESLCKSHHCILEIRRSSKMKSLIRKLRLDIYAQLIVVEICDQAESLLKDPIKPLPNGEQFQLSLTQPFINLFQKFFADDVFIKEQSQDFAVLAMKLLASFEGFVKIQEQFLPRFIVDARSMLRIIIEICPPHIQPPIKLAISSVLNTIDVLEGIQISRVTKLCVDKLDYIHSMSSQLFSSTNTSQRVPSQMASEVMAPYNKWAIGEGSLLANNTNLTTVVTSVLNIFAKQSRDLVEKLKNQLKSLQLFRRNKQSDPNQSLFSVDLARKQLKLDLEVIANYARSKQIQVDNYEVYISLIQYLDIVENDSNNKL